MAPTLRRRERSATLSPPLSPASSLSSLSSVSLPLAADPSSSTENSQNPPELSAAEGITHSSSRSQTAGSGPAARDEGSDVEIGKQLIFLSIRLSY